MQKLQLHILALKGVDMLMLCSYLGNENQLVQVQFINKITPPKPPMHTLEIKSTISKFMKNISQSHEYSSQAKFES